MKKIINFIVDKRILVLCIMLVITVVCALLIPRVEINTDMTKYLPNDSSMKQGVDIMEQEFENTELMQTIRVMFKDLPEAERLDVQSKLEAIQYVDSVDYKSGNEDYNREAYALYVVNTTYDYGSTEEFAIEQAITGGFTEYDMTMVNDNTSQTNLPPMVIVLALVILLVILFTMCASWFEPVLFLMAIGIAIVINMGTNIFLGTVSNITFSIAAILQLVLSMDYSIILMNRYRQELVHHNNRVDAMKMALLGAFSSISSSAVTTFVGLLMLVFMSFKIGMDLGLVLAKGVLCSLLSIFTVLPGLILLFDKVIRRTAKKEPHIPMGGVSRFSYRMRKVLAGAFVVLFIGSYLLQGFTPIIFTIESEDPIADVFTPTNTLVLLYNNQDADSIIALTDELEENPNVKAAFSYPTTLGRPYTSVELLDVIDEMSDSLGSEMDMNIDATMLNILYYDYYRTGELPPIKVGDLINFIADDVVLNETFAGQMDAGITENVDDMRRFADPEALTTPMNAAELADFFGMDEENIRQLFLYYYTEKGGVDSGRMTLATFAGFVDNDVLTDPDYSSLIPASARSQISPLVTFSDAKKMTTPYTYGDLAQVINMDGMSAENIKLLYVYYYALLDAYQPGGMTIPTFVDFVRGTVANNPTFGAQFPADAMAQMNQMAQFTNADTIQKQMNRAVLAGLLGIDASMIDTLYALYHGSMASADMTMTLPQFTAMLVGVMEDPTMATQFTKEQKTQLTSMNILMQAAVSGQAYTADKMAGLMGSIGLDAAMIGGIYSADFDARTGSAWQSNTMAFAAFTEAAKALPLDEALKSALDTLVSGAPAGDLDMATITGLLVSGLGMDPAEAGTLVGQVFLTVASAGHTMTLPDFVDTFVTMLPAEDSAAQQLLGLQDMIQTAVNGTSLKPAKLAEMMSLDKDMVKILFALSAGTQIPNKTMSPEQFVDYLLSDVAQNPMFSAALGDNTAQLQMMQTIMKSTLSGEVYDYTRLAGLFGMDTQMMKMLFTLHDSYGDTSGWQLSMQQVINFIVDNSGQLGPALGDNLSQLQTAQKLINGAVAGTRYSAPELASLLGMNASDLNGLFLLYVSEYGDTSGWQLSTQTFVDFINSDVLPNEDFADQFSRDDADSLVTAKTLIDAVVSEKPFTSKELTALMAGLSDELDENTMELVCLFYNSTKYANPTWELSLEQLFGYLSGTILNDPRFEDIIDEEMRASIADMEVSLDEAMAQLIGENHSLLMLSTTFPAESDETNVFIEELHNVSDRLFSEDYYLIGNSAMNYEMGNSFDGEMLLITLLTAISIFIVVAVIFKSLAIPTILVLIVQCGVYLTVAFSGLLGYSINYLALLIVQCILMGATIDYGLVFTSYYREKRQVMGIKDALLAAYNGSIHTILTSGLIMILVTGIIGFTISNPTIGQICQTIAMGALSATLLILFVLPGLLAGFDRFVTKKAERMENRQALPPEL